MPLFHQFIENNARRTPCKSALVIDGIRTRYDALEKRATLIAALLIKRGVKPGDRVALYAPISADLIAAFLGVLKSGAITAATHPTYNRSKLLYQLKHTGARVLITDCSEDLQALASEAGLETIIVLGQTQNIPAQVSSLEEALHTLNPDDLATAFPNIDENLPTSIFYTSGSTFNPKGVVVNHRIMIAAASSVIDYLGNTEADTILSYSTLASDYGVYNIMMPLFFGGTAVIESQAATCAEDVLEVIEREQVTGLHVFPPVLFLLADMGAHWQQRLPKLRYTSSSGQPLYPRHIQQIKHALPTVDIFSNYGLTECKRVSYLPPSEITQRPGSVGKPLNGVSVVIVDEHDEPITEPDRVGELLVSSEYLMLEYWKMPEATTKAFKYNCFGREKYYRTGDFFRRDAQGYLYYVCRKDDLFARNLWKVNPREIEQYLASHPSVAQVVVVPVADESAGFVPKACVVLRAGHEDTTEQVLLDYCKAVLDWHMVPTHCVFMDTLPKTDSGKITAKGLI
ncbi:class I adenylate-forming enzyme family protein [Pseudomonas rhizophila]|uniref:class I adenylate-forming enzyme family protein n=1 Tax=Pseudomonas rhizophila TaxID=2045200 RepID=UPI0030D9DC15